MPDCQIRMITDSDNQDTKFAWQRAKAISPRIQSATQMTDIHLDTDHDGPCLSIG